MGHKHSLEKLITKAVSHNGRGLYVMINNDISALADINAEIYQKFVASLEHLAELPADGPGPQFILDNQGDYTLEYQVYDHDGFLDKRFSCIVVLSRLEAKQWIALLINNQIPIFD